LADDKRYFWKSFGKALGAEFREGESITGASGIAHPMQAICVDDKSKRLILFSNEPDPRVAALIQGDIQTTMPDVSVLVARPTVYDLAALIRTFFADATSAILSFEQVHAFTTEFNALPEEQRQAFISSGKLSDQFAMLGRMGTAIKHVPFPALTHAGALLQQATLINWPQVLETMKQSSDAKELVGSISLSRLYEFDSSAIDRAYGVCPVPLYQLEDKDWELFLEGRHIDEVQERLKSLNIFQYFFPPPDQLALAIAERGISKREEITDVVASAPSLGHPFGANELIPTRSDIKDIIEQLSEGSFVNEVDHTIKLTGEGTTSRLKIRATPRESAVSKLVNRFKFTVRLSTKDFWPKLPS
jgi:hypothetical protein